MALLSAPRQPFGPRLWLLLLGCSLSWAAPVPTEYQVKAVFLFNFAQFVEWPAESFGRPDAPFVIGVLGEDPFGPDLDNVVRGEEVNQHPFVVKRFHDLLEIKDCKILFIGRNQAVHRDEIAAALKGRSILTVSDADGTEPRGVMIGLITQNNRIRLRIDLAAAKADNLTISSKLLRPAEIVGGGGPGG